MVVKFALRPKQWDKPRRKKKVLAVGPLVGSKTYEDKSPGILLGDRDPMHFIPEEEEDNLSALELALNNTDTQVVTPLDSKQRPARNLLRYLRKPNKPVVATAVTLDETRDDAALPRHPSHGSLSRSASVPQKKEPTAYCISLTSLSLTGLTPTAAVDMPHRPTTPLKVKAYVRVVRKVSGCQMLPNAPRLLKSQRLLNTATTVTWPPESSTLHMQSSLQYRNQLCLEVGLVTPDGMAPLGTATFAPGGVATAPVKRLVPVERIATASRLRHKLFLARKKTAPEGAPVLPGNETPYRLSRNATLAVSYTVQRVALAPEAAVPVVNRAPSAAEPIPADATEDVPPMPAETPVGVMSYLSDPLSCCSGDEAVLNVESEDEEEEEEAVVSPEEKVAVPPRRDIVFEDPTIFPDEEPAATTDSSYWCCGWLCCGGTSSNKQSLEDVTFDEDASDARMASMLEEDVTALSKEDEDEILAKEDKPTKDEMKLNTARQDRTSANCADDVATYERVDQLSSPAHPNCCMRCFGDEDVENLKYAYIAVEDDLSIPPVAVVDPKVRTSPSSGALSHGESNIHEDITLPASGGKKEVDAPPPYGPQRSQSQLERVLDTRSSSISAENGDEEDSSNYTTSFSETLLPEEEGTGCFPCLAVMSSEGEMSSSISHYDSLSGMTQVEPNESLTNQEIRIPPEVDRKI